MLIAAVGIILSIIGIFAVKTKENATMKNLLNSLAAGTNLSSVLIVAATFGILYMLDIPNWINLSLAVVVGLAVGIVIGRATEYYTSQSYKPTKTLAESGQTGPRHSDYLRCGSRHGLYRHPRHLRGGRHHPLLLAGVRL